MTKKELIYHIADSAPVTPRQVRIVLEKVLDTITRELACGGTVQLTNFGTFDTKVRAKREVKNPRTGEPMTVPAHNRPTFRPGKALKEAVNQ